MDGTRTEPDPVSTLRRLYRFMASRWFVAGRDELVGEGFSLSRIKNWCRTGRLIRVIRGAYAYGRDVDCHEAAWRAALLAAGPGSVLTGRSACEAWGIVTPRGRIPRVIEVAVPTGQARRIKGLSPALRHTTVKVVRRRFSPGDVRQKDGLPVVRAPLALIEFSASARNREVRFAFLEACRLNYLNDRELALCLRRMAGRRGAKTLRPYLSLWVPQLKRVKSVLEGWFLLEWVKCKYLMPRVNEPLFGYEVDMYWPAQGVVLELDGDAFHSDPVQKRLDREKQRYIESRGLIVIRVTYKEFAADPEAVIRRIAQALGLV